MQKHPYTAGLACFVGCLVVGVTGCARPSAQAGEEPAYVSEDFGGPNRFVVVVDPTESMAAGDPVEDAKEGEGFRFPDDRGGQILSKVLPPSEKAPPAGHDAPAPRRHPPPPNVEKPTAPLPPVPVDLPRLPAGKPEPLRPRPLPEDLPIFGHKSDPILPQVQTLPAGERVRIPSVDVDQPIPVPILARPATERAPLDDATTAASQNAALSTVPPTRATPAPYLKIGVPDPFENRLRESAAPPETVTPTHTGSRPAR